VRAQRGGDMIKSHICVVCGKHLSLDEKQAVASDGPMHLDCANRMVTLWQPVLPNAGSGPVYRDLDDALAEIKLHLESGEEQTATIQRLSMKEGKFRSLLEFAGY